MAEGAEAPKTEPIPTDQQAVKTENEEQIGAQPDVLEEDDDFEEFQDDGFGDNADAADDQVEWEDDWDDEVEGEDDFGKRLREQLEAHNDQ